MTQTSAEQERARTVMRGIGIMTIAMLIVPSMDVMAKVLTREMSGLEVALGRFVAQFIMAAIVGVAIGEGRRLVPPSLPAHLLRGFFIAATSMLFFSALAVMPLTDALAIAFAEPMILTAVSPWLLGETVGWRRWSACGVGFIGTLMIIRPSFEQFGATALLPLGAAFTFAGYHVMTRRLSGQGGLVAIQFATGFAGLISVAPILVAARAAGFVAEPIVMPSAFALGIFAVVGALSFLTHGMIIKAFALAPAAVLAPFGYLEIVTATILGYVVFGDFPDGPTWGGIGLIMASGLYIVHRERLRGRSRKLPPAT